MSITSSIEWTQSTWNPVRGCTKISPGCKHCYASTFAERFRGVPKHPFEQGFDLRLVPEKLEEPLRWKKPKTIFVNSMSDLFQADIPTSFIRNVADVMMSAKHHTYQILTKRHMRMQQVLNSKEFEDVAHAEHIWWGVSVEDKQYGLPRLKALQSTLVINRFLSIEPLLEDLGEINLNGIGWVIVGGESGPGARPMKPEWVRRIREHCHADNIPFFFKQWGGVRKKATGRVLDNQTYDALPILQP